MKRRSFLVGMGSNIAALSFLDLPTVAENIVVDWKCDQRQSITVRSSGRVTFEPPERPDNLMLAVTQDEVGSRAPTFPRNMKTPNGLLDLDGSPGRTTIINLLWDDNHYYAIAFIGAKEVVTQSLV